MRRIIHIIRSKTRGIIKRPKFLRPRIRRRGRYLLSLDNENKLKRLWAVRVNCWRVIALLAALFAINVGVGYVIFSLTPLRNLLPDAEELVESRRYSYTMHMLDSLSMQAAVSALYIENINAAFGGELSPDSIKPDTTAFTALDTTALLSPSEREREFLANYSSHEGYALDSTSTVLPEAPAFVAPVRDVMTRRAGRSLNPQFQITASKTDVFAIGRGAVVAVGTNDDKASYIVIQHPDGYLSRYDNLDKAYVKMGQDITSGQKIGLYALPSGRPLNFSLYRDGVNIDPFQYIHF